MARRVELLVIRASKLHRTKSLLRSKREGERETFQRSRFPAQHRRPYKTVRLPRVSWSVLDLIKRVDQRQDWRILSSVLSMEICDGLVNLQHTVPYVENPARQCPLFECTKRMIDWLVCF